MSLNKLTAIDPECTLPIQVDPKAPLAINAQIAEQIKLLIAIGKLQVGDFLPPTTILAKQLDVNHNTIASVYSSLTDSAYLSAQRGKGTFVADTLCVHNLIKNNQHYILLRQAFAAAKEIGLSPADLAGAAYAQAVMVSGSQSNPLKLVFVEEQSPYGLEIYKLVQTEVSLPVYFAGWTALAARLPEAMEKLHSADLVIATADGSEQMTQLSDLCKEIAVLEVRPSSELLTQASSLPRYAQVLIVGCDYSEAKRLKQLLEHSGIFHIHLHTADVEHIQQHPENLEKFDSVYISSQAELQSQVAKAVHHPNLSVFSFRIDPTNLLVLKARISSIRSH